MAADGLEPGAPGQVRPHTSTLARLLVLLSDGLCGVAGMGVVIVVLVQVAGRLLGAPVSWSEELTRALFIWMVYLGLASSMRQADAARVTVFLEAMPASMRKLILPVYAVSCIGFFALMGWTGFGMVRQQFLMNEHIATLGWPSWVIGLVMPVGALIAAVCTLQSLVERRHSIALDWDDEQPKATS